MREHLYLFFLLHFSKGCIVSDEDQTKVMSGYSGGSVLLPCSCAQPQSTVHTFSWQFHHNNNPWILVFEDQKYRDRLVLFNESSPTNLSLLVSDLRKTDEGDYKCLTALNTPTFVRLTVQERSDVHPAISTTHRPSDQTLPNTKLPAPRQPQHTLQYVFILLGIFLSVLSLTLLVFIYWRCRGSRNGKKEIKKESNDGEALKKEPDSHDDVMYSTVVHVKTASKVSDTQYHHEELTEYSSINVKCL
ncbi:uncharacterized protein si:dkey-15j16.3 [Danio aesculapii]|uniref:uncharacterized protein si:dkey-15j16.3 n=1 Tax=Danio aesculapii TaxID=1142201 RepID=UPI0024BF41BB|nr:uncharacterized protein si:dkey-15j16.3 [Danio aesculapii]